MNWQAERFGATKVGTRPGLSFFRRSRSGFKPNGISAIQSHFVKGDAQKRRRSVRHKKENLLQVLVRDNNVEQALRVLKKKLQREGVFREMKARQAFEKPSEKRAREKAEAIRRSRKLARKQAQREGLLPAPKKKVPAARGGR
jgi:small subunit ribosomal protein S21